MTIMVNGQASDDASLVVTSIYADEADFQDLLEYFVTALPERRMQLLAGMEEGDLYSMKSVAHQLKGAGGGYGYPGLTERSEHLEKVCRAEKHAEIPGALQTLVSYIDQICR